MRMVSLAAACVLALSLRLGIAAGASGAGVAGRMGEKADPGSFAASLALAP
jgi:hypothetical protein